MNSARTIEVRAVVHQPDGHVRPAGDGEAPMAWAVYRRGADGLAQCVADVYDEGAARIMARALARAVTPRAPRADRGWHWYGAGEFREDLDRIGELLGGFTYEVQSVNGQNYIRRVF